MQGLIISHSGFNEVDKYIIVYLVHLVGATSHASIKPSTTHLVIDKVIIFRVSVIEMVRPKVNVIKKP